MKITGNTILITGGTSGIGLGLALRLHEAGNKVIVAGRRKELLDGITAEHPGIDGLVLDVADPDSIARAREAVAASHPGLNVLVNNAGIMQLENVLDPAGLQVAEDHVATNLLGTIRMTYAFLPQLGGKEDAVVMNVTSALAFVPYQSTPTYSATKAALHSFSESLRIQLASADAGVQVIEVVPPGEDRRPAAAWPRGPRCCDGGRQIPTAAAGASTDDHVHAPSTSLPRQARHHPQRQH
ncbi:SDR family oxidoreductase [Streptomyces pseudovenezuelae]|uniref:SDR family oxidoreductase n=1 Tax=Streptomyces pseudovenezuelae TaxID=67350 RepID=UPI00380FB3D3